MFLAMPRIRLDRRFGRLWTSLNLFGRHIHIQAGAGDDQMQRPAIVQWRRHDIEIVCWTRQRRVVTRLLPLGSCRCGVSFRICLGKDQNLRKSAES